MLSIKHVIFTYVLICSCISRYRGARCDLFTQVDVVKPLEELSLNEPKSDPCESGCESNLARVLLSSAIGILLLLFLLFFLCSIFQICYKKRQSSGKACSPVKKSVVCEQDDKGNDSKFNYHPKNLSLPKQSNSQSSKVYVNPLFDTYTTKRLPMNSLTHKLRKDPPNSMQDYCHYRHHNQHHHQCNTNIHFNCNKDCQLGHDESLIPFSLNPMIYTETNSGQLSQQRIIQKALHKQVNEGKDQIKSSSTVEINYKFYCIWRIERFSIYEYPNDDNNDITTNNNDSNIFNWNNTDNSNMMDCFNHFQCSTLMNRPTKPENLAHNTKVFANHDNHCSAHTLPLVSLTQNHYLHEHNIQTDKINGHSLVQL
ncbi:unnamed protein product [Heterobilharzia americana]|nr:unnamed protein product [Heterobilharzia americana]